MSLPLTSRAARPEGSVVELPNGARVGRGAPLLFVAGPCSVESEEVLALVADAARDAGCLALRGGAYKPRTSPYAFQGLGRVGLRLLRDAADRRGLAVVSECLSEEDAPHFDAVDVVQVGARNMHNAALLRRVSRLGKPVLLKRGLAATLEELLGAAEYVLREGATPILCERGIRSFDPSTRNVLDAVAIAALRERTHLPVVVDPSHATGKASLVLPAALAGVAAGADGVLVEVHPRPEEALSDGPQALLPDRLRELTTRASAVRRASRGGVDT